MVDPLDTISADQPNKGAIRGATPCSASRPLSPCRNAPSKVRGIPSIQRPTTGELATAKLARRLFDDKLVTPAKEKYLGTLETKERDVVFHKYKGPNATPVTLQERFSVFGVRTPGGGYGKGLFRSLQGEAPFDATAH